MDIIKGFPATSNKNYHLNVTNLLKHGARNFGRQEIVSRKHDGSLFRYTYKDAYERTRCLADSLKTLGINVGDRVGVLAWNTHENYEIYFGVPGTGAVMLLLNLRLSPQELAYIINHSEAKTIFVDETLLDIAETIAPLCKSVKGYVIITNKDLASISTELKPVYIYEELLKKANSDYKFPILDETSAYSACYTTGTTGKPKGVYNSHREIYLQAMMYAANASFTVNDCIFQIVPMYHVLAWGTLQAATMSGAKLVLPGKYSLEKVNELVDILIYEKVTVFNGATAFIMPMLEYIRELEQKPDFSTVKFVCGASEPPVEMMKGYKEMTGAEVIHTYGATEAQAVVTINLSKPWLETELSDDEKWDLKRKQGYVVVGLDVKIVDSNGVELPHNGEKVGEVLIRGPWITNSYYNATDIENQFTEDGFWKSGDVGSIDSEGYLKITDRLKDVIKSGGEWISSIDLENCITSHPSVLEAAVVGIRHPKWQERPLALVIQRKTVTKEELLKYLTNSFAKWQLPDEIIFIDIIPKTSIGKIDKKEIREIYQTFYEKNC